MWIYVGLLLGSLVTSTHDNREACEGRAVVLKEKGVVGKRETAPMNLTGSITGSSSGSYLVCDPRGNCR